MKLWLLVRDSDEVEPMLDSIWDDKPESYESVKRIIEKVPGDYTIIRGVAISIEDVKR